MTTTIDKTYSVTVAADGEACGTYVVTAPRPGLAQTRALVEMFHRMDQGVDLPFVSGCYVTYDVAEVDSTPLDALGVGYISAEEWLRKYGGR